MMTMKLSGELYTHMYNTRKWEVVEKYDDLSFDL